MKKKKKKDININITPCDTKIRTFEKGFVWSFYTPINGKYDRKKIINIRFDRWWLVYLSKDLKKVIKSEKQELDRIIELTEFMINEKAE